MTMGFTSENSGKSKIYFHANCSNSKIILMQETLCTNPYTSNYILSSAMPQHQNVLVISVIFSSVWIFRDEGLLWHRYIPRSLFKQQDYSYARGDVRQDGTGNLFDDRRRIYGLLSVSICNINSFDFPYDYYKFQTITGYAHWQSVMCSNSVISGTFYLIWINGALVERHVMFRCESWWF